MDRGEFVPDDVVVEMVLHGSRSPTPRRGSSSTGSRAPSRRRRRSSDALADAGRPLYAVLKFAIADEMAIRGSWRADLPELQADLQPRVQAACEEGICDVCGHELERRSDDDEVTVRRRLEVYHADRAARAVLSGSGACCARSTRRRVRTTSTERTMAVLADLEE